MSYGMKPYGNGNGTSGIVGYFIDPDDAFMDIEYANGGVYTYQKQNVGELNFLNMKVLALTGQGLNGFINKHVRTNRNRYPKASVNASVDTPLTINITTTKRRASAILTALTAFDVSFRVY